MLISCQSYYRVRVVSRVVTRIATPTPKHSCLQNSLIYVLTLISILIYSHHNIFLQKSLNIRPSCSLFKFLCQFLKIYAISSIVSTKQYHYFSILTPIFTKFLPLVLIDILNLFLASIIQNFIIYVKISFCP